MKLKLLSSTMNDGIESEPRMAGERLRHVLVSNKNGLTIKPLSGDVETATKELEAELADGVTQATLLLLPYGAHMLKFEGGHPGLFIREAGARMFQLANIGLGGVGIAPQDIRSDAARFRHLLKMGLFGSGPMGPTGRYKMYTNAMSLGDGGSYRDAIDRLIAKDAESPVMPGEDWD